MYVHCTYEHMVYVFGFVDISDVAVENLVKPDQIMLDELSQNSVT